MVELPRQIQEPLTQAYHLSVSTASAIQQEVSNILHGMQNFASDTYHLASQKTVNTANCIRDFVYNNKETLFFIGCSAVTAYFAPQMFFAAAVITILIRVETAWQMEKAANYFLKDERNPYLQNPSYGPNYISPLTLAMGTISAVNSLALGTFYLAGSGALALLPAVGGIAFGNAAAELGMDIAHSFG